MSVSDTRSSKPQGQPFTVLSADLKETLARFARVGSRYKRRAPQKLLLSLFASTMLPAYSTVPRTGLL